MIKKENHRSGKKNKHMNKKENNKISNKHTKGNKINNHTLNNKDLKEKTSRALKILKILEKEYSGLTTALNFKTPFQLLIATMLSAQCTDERVNIVTKELFKHYPKAENFAMLKQEKLEQMIRSTGFYRNKAKNIIAASKIITKNFNGKLPRTMEQLLTLPGVARKTANIVLTYGFGINKGIAVDTHVKRLSIRLGLTSQKNPDKIEQDLIAIIPHKYWPIVNNVLVWHGRKICKARKPLCNKCKINHLCLSAFKV